MQLYGRIVLFIEQTGNLNYYADMFMPDNKILNNLKIDHARENYESKVDILTHTHKIWENNIIINISQEK